MSAAPVVGRLSTEESRELSNQWRALRRAATAVALLTSPALFIWLYKMQEVTLAWAIVATILGVAAFRGLLDLIFHRFIEWPSLFGIDNPELREEDVVARRRVWFWRWWAKIAWFFLLIIFAVYAVHVLKYGIADASIVGSAQDTWHWLTSKLHPNGHHARRPLQLRHLLRLQLRDPDGPAALHGHLADPRLRAGRRGLGREAQRRARPGRGQGGSPARRQPLAVGRGLREGRRPARARAALPRARPAPARRCSPRRSRPASTRRS